MLTYTFLRHGESEGNSGGYIQGQSDHGLTEHGREQARRLGEYWRQRGVTFDRIIASPLVRACETAQIVAGALGLAYTCEPAWMERKFGAIEGMTFEQAVESMGSRDNFYHPYLPPGGDGESTVDLYLRASAAVQDLTRLTEGRYLIVTHGAMLNMVMFAILGITPQGNHASPRFAFENTAFSVVSYEPNLGQWRVHGLNRYPHLE